MDSSNWESLSQLEPRAYACGYCNMMIGTNSGYYFRGRPDLLIYICSFCKQPSYFNDDLDTQIPGVAYGDVVESLPADVASLYEEARKCMAASAHTAAALLARKLLMNVAVEQGAKENQTFLSYVEYLADNGYVPPNGRAWVDHIRDKGNEAAHEIRLISKAEAELLIAFLAMLLKFIYEFPGKLPQKEGGSA